MSLLLVIKPRKVDTFNCFQHGLILLFAKLEGSQFKQSPVPERTFRITFQKISNLIFGIPVVELQTTQSLVEQRFGFNIRIVARLVCKPVKFVKRRNKIACRI